MIPFQADEVIRLTSQLSPQQREAAWRALVPRTAPHSIPDGSMTIGAVRATAELALRSAVETGAPSSFAVVPCPLVFNIPPQPL